MPFTSLRLKAPRPRSLPRGYPTTLGTLGDHLRKNRLDLGLQQRTVAKRLGVRVETIGRWEKGLARPLPRHYGHILAFLGYDPEPVGEGVLARLNAARRRLGLTLAQLAEWTGFDEGSLTRWLNQSRHPSPRMAGRLLKALTKLEERIRAHCKTRNFLTCAEPPAASRKK